MRIRSFAAWIALASLFFLTGGSSLVSAKDGSIGAQGKSDQPNVSAGEQKAAEAITSAPDPAAKRKAGAAFIKKYPKSTLRSRVAQALENDIPAVTDPSQKISLAPKYQGDFREPTEH